MINRLIHITLNGFTLKYGSNEQADVQQTKYLNNMVMIITGKHSEVISAARLFLSLQDTCRHHLEVVMRKMSQNAVRTVR